VRTINGERMKKTRTSKPKLCEDSKSSAPDDDDDMIQITDENRELIFDAYDIDTKKLVCAYCGEQILKKNVAIFPIDHKGKNYKLCCGNSVFCTLEALNEWDAVKEEISKTKGFKEYEAEIEKLKEENKFLRGGKIMTANNKEVLSKDMANEVIRKLKASRRKLAEEIALESAPFPDLRYGLPVGDINEVCGIIGTHDKEKAIKTWIKWSEE